jgi:glycosyltransferase involved in cell wall biosynthesis
MNTPRAPRILVIANDAPLPANSGGRVDVWRSLQALHRGGARLALQGWLDAGRGTHPDATLLQQLRAVCDTVNLTPITRSPREILQRLLRLAWLPSHAASRWVTLDRAQLLADARRFAPDAIWLTGLYGGASAIWLSRSLGVPLLYRSHNVEHLYMRRQLAHAVGLTQRLGLLANLIGLRRFERRVMRAARVVFDISQDDQAWWRAQGFAQVEWLPTLVDDDMARALSQPAEARFDVIYFGNLRTPNNVDAVRWLVEAVLPRLQRPGLRVLLAGSDPSADVQRLAASDARIELIANPPDMPSLVRQGRVLVNPVRAGSGVNLKSVEMLFTRSALVSTRVGVQGLPATVQACFALADDADAFARAIEQGLDAVPTPEQLRQRQDVGHLFSAAAMIDTVFHHIRPLGGARA